MRRREFLKRGGELALAAGAASWLELDRLAGEAQAAGRIRKCLSMGGPGPMRVDDSADDYRLWGNREYIRDSHTTWVKLWISWNDLQKELAAAPASRAGSWDHLNSAPGGQSWMRRLDRQVKAINDDRLGVILTLYQAFPTWANGATGVDPVGRSKPAEQKVPLDLSTNGPWGWFIGHLLARYKSGASPNPIGPHEPAAGENPAVSRFGNPDGAVISALEICNEPNQLYWPQEGIDVAVAQMIRTATTLSRTWGPTMILAPATGDYPDEVDIVNSRGIVSAAWEGFIKRVLAALDGFQPGVPMRWSHHNYRETRFAEAPQRSRRVLRLLRTADWQMGRQPLWLTEGGYNMRTLWQDPQTRTDQANLIEQSLRHSALCDEVFMSTQHTISDKQGNDWKGGLRDDFVQGVGPGQPRPSWYSFRELPSYTRV
jgi:hypothetical protein